VDLQQKIWETNLNVMDSSETENSSRPGPTCTTNDDDEKPLATMFRSLTPGSSIASISLSTASSSNNSSNNNYYQRRFNGTKRRTELLEKLSKKTTINISPNRKESTTKIVDIDDAPEIPIDKKDNENGNGNGKCRKLLSPPSLKLSTTYTDIITANVIGESEEVDVIGTTRTRIDCVNINTSSCIPDTSTCINIDIDTDRNSFDDGRPVLEPSFSTPNRHNQRQRQPLHLEIDGIEHGQLSHHNHDQQQQKLQGSEQEEDEGERRINEQPAIQYYRIVYRGVVALLSNEPTDTDTSSSSSNISSSNKKSGKYLGFGEIIASSNERLIEDVTLHPTKATAYGLRRNNNPSPRRLGSAVDSPILAEVWEKEVQQQKQIPLIPHSPPQSLVSDMSTFTNNTAITTYSTTTTTTTASASATTSTSAPIKMRKVIRVDRVITGGYALDANEESEAVVAGPSSLPISFFSTNDNVKSHDMTPKRGNIQCVTVPLLCSSSLPIPDDNYNNTTSNTVAIQQLSSEKKDNNENRNDNNNDNNPHHGYIFSTQSNVQIAIPIDIVPICEQGSFMYRVICSTPVPIFTGPCFDAPSTKGILIPGSIHEVCLRLVQEEEQDHTTKTTTNDSNSSVSISFLRLTRRRGWVADRKLITRRGGHNTYRNKIKDSISNIKSNCSFIPLMKEISNEEVDECGLSVTSRVTSGFTMSSTLVTPVSAANRRHRPPRRKRGDGRMNGLIDSNPLPRHVVGPSLQYRNDASNNNNDASSLTDTSTSIHNSQNHDPRTILSPSSNVSLLSDDASSLDHANKSYGGTLSPDRSVARSTASSSVHRASFFLMRVNAPRGLKILDAPHFQVNNLIHGSHATISSGGASTGNNLHHHHDALSTSTYSSTKDGIYGKAGNQSIFQTMTGHHTTTMTSKTSNSAIFDSITKARKLPRGSVFEATKRLVESNVFSQGAGLIKLSDHSGWAIVPRQDELNDQYISYSGALAYTREGEATKAFEEVGNSIGNNRQDTVFLRVLSRNGVSVHLPPTSNTDSDVDISPSSSAAGSSLVSSMNGLPLLKGGVSQESDIASSVASSFLDSMFRTPKKGRDLESNESKRDYQNNNYQRPPTSKRHVISTIIPCGTCVEVDRWVDPPDMGRYLFKNEFARLRGGQGWIPRFVNGKPVVETGTPPKFRFGSFWFRVRERRGIKVRLGPSRRASSIKSDDGVYFRFECGEFLRASEVVTFFRHNSTRESFAKLYRNRHVRLRTGELRPLSSLTAQAEWVQVFGDREMFLDECTTEPRIERHRQGWRYNVVLDVKITIRKGPSFEAETDGVVLLGGESVLVNERVTGPDDSITWLRLKDGQGWAHNIGQNGESLMILHSLRHRLAGAGRPTKPGRSKQEEIAYNTIIARLFHSDVPGDSPPRRL